VPAAAVPLKVAVPFPLLVNVKVAGNAPVSLNVGAGVPVATNVSAPATPTTKVFGLLELGIVGGEGSGGGVADCPPPVQPARLSPKTPNRKKTPRIRPVMRGRWVLEAHASRRPAIVRVVEIKEKPKRELEIETHANTEGALPMPTGRA